jgi:hypothetical protein
LRPKSPLSPISTSHAAADSFHPPEVDELMG